MYVFNTEISSLANSRLSSAILFQSRLIQRFALSLWRAPRLGSYRCLETQRNVQQERLTSAKKNSMNPLFLNISKSHERNNRCRKTHTKLCLSLLPMQKIGEVKNKTLEIYLGGREVQTSTIAKAVRALADNKRKTKWRKRRKRRKGVVWKWKWRKPNAFFLLVF